MSINETRITSKQTFGCRNVLGANEWFEYTSYVQYLKQTLSPSSFPTQLFL